MEIMTYTNVWSTPKRLYALGDLQLPQPISLVSAALFLLVAAPWWTMLYILNISVASSLGVIIYLSAPIALAVIGTKPIFEGKSIFQYALSMGRFFTEPRHWASMAPAIEEAGSEIAVRGNVWIPDNPTKALPKSSKEN